MNMQMNFLNTEETARLLGVNISTIKRWTDSGKLQCTKTAGGHRKFYMAQLADFLEQNQKQAENIQMFPLENSEELELSFKILHADYNFLVPYSRQQALNCNRQRLQQVVNGLYLGQQPLFKIYDHLIAPILREIGLMWEKGMISVTEEHLASQTIKDVLIRLQGILKLPVRKSGIAMCMNLRDEQHDIALKMVDHILELRGFKVLFSGQNTPLIKIEQVFESYAPRRLYISSTFVKDTKEIQKEFDRICDISQRHGVKVYLGGPGFRDLDTNHDVIAQELKTFEDVYKN